ncbi:HAD family phosphatase [Lacihabitans sp. LS3-19]|uniref:HAD family hydrolase n=1 Tax=Lacihabitans sp. LS3-19 TaxID=2487335 RepID=UPI0020CD4027|nr:HAD family phosphatase [Lacihabitans sp. LS3-19]MCP9769852.1 HAD family phosphatase [Lacihabitans sp. LS3-19]
MVLKDTIKAVIFDFGNVIINIDLEKTYEAFAELTFKSPNKIKALFAESDVFRKYESGFYSDEEFRDVIRQVLSYPLNDQEIDKAWNALLLNVPKNRIEFLEQLKYKYPIYLLSNTNNIHIEKCMQYFRQSHGINNFQNLFSETFLSYKMGLWKPDYRIYDKVLSEINLKPEEVLFIDDNQENIIAAQDLRINCIKINPPECFTEILNHIF